MRNAIDGVTKGYERVLEISGVGFKAEVKGKEINFTLGFSHPVVFELPEGVTAEVDPKQTRVTIKGVDKHLLGLTAAKIRGPPPAGAVQGQGHQVRGGDGPSQGRQDRRGVSAAPNHSCGG